MKNSRINSVDLKELSGCELVSINGGYAEYEEGYAAGQFVRKVVGGVLLLSGLAAML